jgi:hypothetical protein
MADRTIYVVNASTLVSDADVVRMTAACAAQLTRDVAPAHGMLPVPVVPISKSAVRKGQRVISVVDTLDEADALGWHTEDAGEHAYGVVGCKAVLNQGAKALTGAYSVSSVLSHEIVEMFVDSTCALWADSGRGYMVAYEACDPVQSGYYDLGGVTVSDFVTADWFDVNNSGDPVSHLGTIKKPFQLAKGGYWVQATEGRTSQKFGEGFPEWLKALKQHEHTRTQRHSAAA